MVDKAPNTEISRLERRLFILLGFLAGLQACGAVVAYLGLGDSPPAPKLIDLAWATITGVGPIIVMVIGLTVVRVGRESAQWSMRMTGLVWTVLGLIELAYAATQLLNLGALSENASLQNSLVMLTNVGTIASLCMLYAGLAKSRGGLRLGPLVNICGLAFVVGFGGFLWLIIAARTMDPQDFYRSVQWESVVRTLAGVIALAVLMIILKGSKTPPTESEPSEVDMTQWKGVRLAATLLLLGIGLNVLATMSSLVSGIALESVLGPERLERLLDALPWIAVAIGAIFPAAFLVGLTSPLETKTRLWFGAGLVSSVTCLGLSVWLQAFSEGVDGNTLLMVGIAILLSAEMSAAATLGGMGEAGRRLQVGHAIVYARDGIGVTLFVSFSGLTTLFWVAKQQLMGAGLSVCVMSALALAQLVYLVALLSAVRGAVSRAGGRG